MSSSQFVKITKLNPKTYKKLPNLSLNYGTASTKFGNCLSAYQGNVLCYLTFFDKEVPLEDLKKVFPKASFYENEPLVSANVSKLFEGGGNNVELYLKGTDFEMEVWEALLNLKKGTTASYEEVARAVGRPKAVRAVANAIAKNNLAYVVPCHRVIKKNGSVHKYRSGATRKVEMLKDEGAI